MGLTITCPICGPRNGYEFCYGNEDKGPRPSEKDLSAAQWCRYVHMNCSLAGIQKEWWCHQDGCGTWFSIFRDTRTNRQVAAQEEPSS